MKVETRCAWSGKVALAVLVSFVCSPALADGGEQKTAPAGPGGKASAMAIHVEAKGESNPSAALLSLDEYRIGPQDVVAINVWREPEISRAVPVRPDGKISLPLVGEIKASGLTPRMLQAQITKELEAYLHRPEVTVILQEVNSHKFNILGEVQRPGSYLLASSMTVLDALATAGGFREFAKVKRIYMLRRMPDGTRRRIPFNYKEAMRGRKLSLDLELLPGDTIVVP